MDAERSYENSDGAVAVYDAVDLPRNSKWHCEEPDAGMSDENGYFVGGAEIDISEMREDDSFKSVVYGEGMPKIYYNSIIVDLDTSLPGAKNRGKDKDDEFSDCKQQRLDYLAVCRQPHMCFDFSNGLFSRGRCIWNVISIKIRRTMKYPESKVRIHGAIRVVSGGHFVDYIFRRAEDSAQEFENPGEELTLALDGPDKPWVLRSEFTGVTLYFLLKYNNRDIFAIRPDADEGILNGCPDIFEDNNGGYGGDFVGCRHLFGKQDDNVGCAVLYIPQIDGRCLYKTEIYPVILDEVASVQVEVGHTLHGIVAMLKVTSIIHLDLYGKIAARSCIHENGVVVFEKTRKEAVTIEPHQPIPLSRGFTGIDSRTSLLIHIYLRDAKNSNFVIDETIHFNVGQHECTSRKATLDGVINLEVEWKVPKFNGHYFVGNPLVSWPLVPKKIKKEEPLLLEPLNDLFPGDW